MIPALAPALGRVPDLAAVPPRMDAINLALRVRRQQLAMAWVPQLGTRVRDGVFQGLDLGGQLLHRPAPLTRLLGLAHAGWLDQVLALCEARSGLLHLGAPDGFVAAGLLQAGCVARAWVAPGAGDAAAQALADDSERLGLQATLQPLPPQPAPDPVGQQGLVNDLEASPHLLCVAEDSTMLALWLAGLPASVWQRCTLVWPAGCEADLAPQALAMLQMHFGPRSDWHRLVATETKHGDGVLAALDATDQALVRSDAGPSAWMCAQGPAVRKRRRTLVCTYAEDKFIARLLATVQLDADDLFDLDVLVYRDGTTQPGIAAQPAALAHRYPAGVRVFQLGEAQAPDGSRVMDALLPVLDSQGRQVATATEFFGGYQRFAVWSIGPANAALLQWLSAHHGRERVMVLVSDDEIDLRHKAQQYLATGRADLAAIAHARFPPAMEQAFEAVRHFWIVRDPWEQMLRQQRRSDLVMHPMILPIHSAPPRVREVQPRDDAYVLMLHPKPSLPRDVAMAQLEAFIARWQVDRPLRVLTLRNDMGSGLLAMPGGRGQVQLQVYPAPLSLNFYYELMAGCHGLMLVPRGGMTSTFEAVRMGMDLFDDGTPFSPNRSQLRNCLGLHVHGLDEVHALHGQHVGSAALRQRNRQRLAAQVALAADTFRRWFVVPGPVGECA